jgi:tRNA threonylcarbamoyladenosine biosynthesis protein TsaE
MTETIICETPEATYELGKNIGGRLRGSDAVLLHGGLGAGKTLLTKGILDALGFDVDEVTSPSFTLVNIYPTDNFDVYHIDLWRLEDDGNAAFAIGLNEIVENEPAVFIIEWAERLGNFVFPGRVLDISIDGSVGFQRSITINET